MEPTPQVLQAIEIAVQIEKEGLAFYNEMTRQTDDPGKKKMFQALAREEAAHLQLFEDARKALLDRGSWLSLQKVVAISPGELDRPLIFPAVDQIEPVDAPEHALAVLQRGIEAEQASIAFYSEQKDKVADPNARAMYAYLIEQEETHREILQREHDYLTRTGLYS